jgi:hypothetical protein
LRRMEVKESDRLRERMWCLVLKMEREARSARDGRSGEKRSGESMSR